MSKSAILTGDLRKKIHDHPQNHTLADGMTEVAKSMGEIFSKVLDTKKKAATPTSVVKSVKANEDSSNRAGKIIDPNIKEIVNNDPNSEIIKILISQITPTLIDSINAANKIPVTSCSVPISSPVLSPISSPANSLLRPVIDEKVRVDINKHPFKDAIKGSINNFAQKFLPAIQQAINKEAAIIAVSSEKLIESKIKGPKGEEIAKLVSSSMLTMGQLASKASSSSTKLLDSDTKDQINNHPFRDIILQFLNSFVPKLLKFVSEMVVVGGEFTGKLIEGTIEKIIPGDVGKKIGMAAEHLIEYGSDHLASGISNMAIHAEHTVIAGAITDGHH